jgi:hypothetical protein
VIPVRTVGWKNVRPRSWRSLARCSSAPPSHRVRDVAFDLGERRLVDQWPDLHLRFDARADLQPSDPGDEAL